MPSASPLSRLPRLALPVIALLLAAPGNPPPLGALALRSSGAPPSPRGEAAGEKTPPTARQRLQRQQALNSSLPLEQKMRVYLDTSGGEK